MPFIENDGVRLHFLEFPANGPLLIMMHGLTANAHAFDGLMNAGLGDHFQVVSIDLRGRGLSDHPPFNYSMPDHASDILALMTHLKAESAIFCGHSFGGLLGFYLAANHPEKVSKLVVLDAAARMNPMAAEMLAFRLGTLDMNYPSFAEYLTEVQSAPYNTFWNVSMKSYYDADIRSNDEGGVTPRPTLANIIQASMGVAAIDWPEMMKNVSAPVLLVNAPENYTLEQPLLPEELAKETVEMLPDARLVTVDGNHQTMLYGIGAQQICDAVMAFTGS